MSDAIEALILDLLEMLAPGPREYGEVMAAWRTSCPQLPVWEEANDRGLVNRGATMVEITPLGREHLYSRRPHLIG